MVMKKVLFLILWLAVTGLYAQIEVSTTAFTVEELIRDVLVDSECAETSNYQSFTGTEFGINGIGYFDGNSSFRFREGILLSTGNAMDAEGPNDQTYDSGPPGWMGDDDLRRVTNTSALFNASYIQFDFIPRTNSISFNFIFASEEYSQEFQCIYSDVFAFILTDSSGNSTNLAIIPGTEDPVRATTVRPGVDGFCEARNEDFFDKINGARSGISFEGQTKELVAESNVIPGERYTIKLAIADNLDSQLDSAVFLEAGSFSIDVSLGDNRTIRDGNPLCNGEMVTLDATADGALEYHWFRDGEALTSLENVPVITVSEEGTYEVEVVFSTVCVSEGMVELEYIVPPSIVEEPLDLTACDLDQDGIEPFDFSDNTQRIIGGQDPNIYRVRYYRSMEDAVAFENAINTSTTYPGTQASETIFVRISSGESCYEITSFELMIQNLELDPILQEEYILCVDAAGVPLMPLPLLETGLSTTEYTFMWYRNAISDENRIAGADNAWYAASSEGVYMVQMESLAFGCSFSYSTSVRSVAPPNVFEVELVSDLFSNNNVVDIVVEGNSEYRYRVDEEPFGASNRFNNLSAGEHIAYVEDIYGCSVVSKEFEIIDFPRYFTPNGDGTNDLWNIQGFDGINDPEIAIYDRLGTLLYQYTGGIGWDGTKNGQRMPATDYWFRITYSRNNERKVFQSHFSLKR